MENKVLDILAEICEDEIVRENLDVDLLGTDLLDSLGFVQLLIDLEDNFGIVIAPSEVEKGDFKTPRMIIDYMKGRVKG